MSAGDPFGAGLIASLARPGGNVTGLSSQTARGEEKRRTSGDFKLVRTMRIVMCGSVAGAWALALVAIAHRPDLIHEPKVAQRHHGSVADNRFCVEWE